MAPVLGHRNIPQTFKVGLLLLLSLTLMPALSLPNMAVADSLWTLAGMAFKEVLVGLIIGLLFRLIFMAVHTAGGMIGYQMGFAMVTQFDANLSGQVAVLGRLWYTVAILIFLAIDGHHLVIRAFAESYTYITPGTVTTASSFGDMMIKYTAYIFVIALKVASPVMITLFLTDVALGTIAKTMPTMNVFFLGIPLKIAVGLTVMAIALPICSYVLQRAVGYFNEQIQVVFATMGEA